MIDFAPSCESLVRSFFAATPCSLNRRSQTRRNGTLAATGHQGSSSEGTSRTPVTSKTNRKNKISISRTESKEPYEQGKRWPSHDCTRMSPEPNDERLRAAQAWLTDHTGRDGDGALPTAHTQVQNHMESISELHGHGPPTNGKRWRSPYCTGTSSERHREHFRAHLAWSELQMPPVEPRAPAPPLAMRTLLRRRSSLPQSACEGKGETDATELHGSRDRAAQGAATELHRGGTTPVHHR